MREKSLYVEWCTYNALVNYDKQNWNNQQGKHSQEADSRCRWSIAVVCVAVAKVSFNSIYLVTYAVVSHLRRRTRTCYICKKGAILDTGGVIYYLHFKQELVKQDDILKYFVTSWYVCLTPWPVGDLRGWL